MVRGRELVLHLRDTEVDELDDALPRVGARDVEVRGLDVAVHDADGMRALEAGERLRDEPQRQIVTNGAEPADEGVEVLALEQLHHQVGSVGRSILPRIEDLRDVGRLDGARGPCLALEARDERRIRAEPVLDHLHGDGAARRDVACGVDRAHGARAELPGDDVLPVDLLADHRARLRARARDHARSATAKAAPSVPFVPRAS